VRSTIGIELVTTMPKDKAHGNSSETWDKHLLCVKCWTFAIIVHPKTCLGILLEV
jgi:hypothetical protein